MKAVEKSEPKPISKKQIKLIKTMQRQNLPDDQYYEILKNRFGVESCKDLTCPQAIRLIDYFKSLGMMRRPLKKLQKTNAGKFKKKSRAKQIARKNSNVIRLASEAEKAKIRALAALIQWKNQDGLSLWMDKFFGISRVKTGNDAYLVIEGLKKLFENKMKEAHGDSWWAMNFDDVNIRRYIQRHCPEEYR